MELNLKLNQKEAQLVLDALVQLPYITVVDVINKIQQQASEQMEQQNPTK